MVFPIFPENGLANSVIPPVLTGLVFSVFFAETLGWNFSGLIVPGYLAPIFVVRPFSGIVIIVEALLTYIILRILADGFSRFGIWTRFFGQDAFFALLCISILVKCTLEGPLQPVIDTMLSQMIPGEFDFRNELHSTGLIVVPLLANIFWRHGLRKNLIPTLTNILLTFLFLKYILIPYTNFSVNKFELMYSKMAINFEESARYYVILLIGAAMATHKKYKFGWSYHGMLIPALLGIAWLTPLKILTTFAEAFCILILALFLVKSRVMRNMTIEGPRKVLLFFSIGFSLKMVIGFALQESLPGFSAIDIYGFAYILPALLAIEMWPGRKILQVSRITLQTSFFAAVFGIAICTGLQVVSPEAFQTIETHGETYIPSGKKIRIREVTESLAVWLNRETESRINWGVYHDGLSTKSLKIMDELLLTPIVKALATGTIEDPQTLDNMNIALRRTGLEMVRLTDPSDGERYWILTEIPPIHYRGIYIFRAGVSQAMTIQVSQSKSEQGTLPIGLYMFRSQNAKALLISGTSRRKQFAEFDVTHLDNRKSLFQLVHQVIHRESIEIDPVLSIQIRGASDLSETDADVILSTGREIRSGISGSQRLNILRSDLLRSSIRAQFFTGTEYDMYLSTHSNAQQAYVETFNMGEFVVLWFDSTFRDCFLPVPINDILIKRLGWMSESGDLAFWLTEQGFTEHGNEISVYDVETEVLVTRIQVELADFVRTRNVAHLDRLTVMSNRAGFKIRDYLDQPTNNRYLVLTSYQQHGKIMLIFNYFAHSSREIIINPEPLVAIRSDLDRFGFCHFAAAVISGETQ
ncbi:poly-gamma-glutamate biosynthesis protein PgsC/CapC [bacterium]|nr:poly-gamma-glutamate biosynthesis protein PgsC/CapC [bacterium]